MKRRFPASFLAITLLGLPVLSAAETKSAPPAPTGKAAIASALAGEYTGAWKGRDETTGALRIKLKPDGAAAWTAEAWFTFEGTEVATKLKSMEVTGAKLEMVFAWEVQGVAAQSKLTWCKILYAGGVSHEGNLLITGEALPVVQHCEIAYSAAYGIWLDGWIHLDPATLRAENNIHDNASGDIRVPPPPGK